MCVCVCVCVLTPVAHVTPASDVTVGVRRRKLAEVRQTHWSDKVRLLHLKTQQHTISILIISTDNQ